jgi:hypothetical protein
LFFTPPTVQALWVQIAVNALNVPFAGWVTTIFCGSSTTPPPTGTWAVATSGPALADGDPELDDVDGVDDAEPDDEDPALDVPPPHAVASAPPAPTTAPSASTWRRVGGAAAGPAGSAGPA